jgi:hypothetical protein
MTKAEYEAMSFEELMEWAHENLDDITTEETLISFAKSKIDDDNLRVALHILKAIYESNCPDDSYYRYDYSMGTLEIPSAVTEKEDIEDLIFFDDVDYNLCGL